MGFTGHIAMALACCSNIESSHRTLSAKMMYQDNLLHLAGGFFVGGVVGFAGYHHMHKQPRAEVGRRGKAGEGIKNKEDHPHPSLIVTDDPEECKDILAVRSLPKYGLEVPNDRHLVPDGARLSPSKIIARANPNRRIAVAFGVLNPFTTTDPVASQKFRGEIVEKKLYMKDDEWTVMAKKVETATKREFQGNEDRTLFKVTQMITMKAALWTLFGLDTDDDRLDDSVFRLATEINEQWLRSKGEFDPATPPAWRFQEQYGLHRALQGIFPDYNVADLADNPLNRILPGYETLWLVVLRCFVELTARGLSGSGDHCNVLQLFAHTSTIEMFTKYLSKFSEYSAMNIAREALRVCIHQPGVSTASTPGRTGRHVSSPQTSKARSASLTCGARILWYSIQSDGRLNSRKANLSRKVFSHSPVFRSLVLPGGHTKNFLQTGSMGNQGCLSVWRWSPRSWGS
jgi:hypothetical protein